jgi:DNA replication and repair protein RecF
VWTDRFVALGDEIDDLRGRAVGRICALAAATYGEIAGGSKRLAVRLERSHDEGGLAEALARTADEERGRGVTVVGPHRDDLAIELDGHSVQAYGSRGEARTAALALRVAEYRLLSEKHGEAPVLLLDDFTAELDASRREYLLALTAATPQALVSGTEPPPHADYALHVQEGRIHGG